MANTSPGFLREASVSRRVSGGNAGGVAAMSRMTSPGMPQGYAV